MRLLRSLLLIPDRDASVHACIDRLRVVLEHPEVQPLFRALAEAPPAEPPGDSATRMEEEVVVDVVVQGREGAGEGGTRTMGEEQRKGGDGDVGEPMAGARVCRR